MLNDKHIVGTERYLYRRKCISKNIPFDCAFSVEESTPVTYINNIFNGIPSNADLVQALLTSSNAQRNNPMPFRWSTTNHCYIDLFTTSKGRLSSFSVWLEGIL